MPVTLIALAILGLARPAIDVTVDATSGDVVGGVREFHVRVGQTKGIVTQVEFYVNHDLRDTVSSIPYNFKLDTVNEDEGNLDLEFRAYTTEGENGKKTITVKVDNQLSKGPDFHTQIARDLLTNSKWDDAILECRIALKAKPGYNPARIAMAMAYRGKGSYDRAQKYAEDALSTEPNNKQAILMLSSINIDRAFGTFSRGASSTETQASIRTALKAAIQGIKKAQDDELDATKPTSDNILQYSDLAMRSGHYSVAVTALYSAVAKDNTRPDLANRLAYALMRVGRFGDATTVLRSLKKYGKYDAYSYALESVLDAAFGDDAASADAIKEALLTDGDDPGVISAEAFLALRKNKIDVLAGHVQQLVDKYPQKTEVKIYMSALLDKQGQYGEARQYFIDAVKAEPTSADAYVQEGNIALEIGLFGNLADGEDKKQAASAETMFLTALEARPESAEALAGLAIAELVLGNNDDAVKYAKAATVTAKSYAAGFYVLAAAYKASHQIDASLMIVQQAGKLDKVHLEGASAPTIKAAWKYFSDAGRIPLLTPPN